MNQAVAEHLLVLLKTHFFNRLDKAAVANKDGRPVPVLIEEGKLEPLLRTHLIGNAGEKVGVTMLKKKGLSATSGWFRVGSYTPSPDNETRWLCIDVDGAGHADAVGDPANSALKIIEQLARYGLTGYLERSGGGNGWHIWVFFEQPVQAAQVRAVAFAVIPKDIPLAKGGYANPKKGKGIEVFPKQDKIDTDTGYGNLIWLPWWFNSKQGCGQFHRQERMELVPYIPERFDAAMPAQFEAALEKAKADSVVAEYETVSITVNADNFPDDWKAWRREALDALSLDQVYGPWLTGGSSGHGWLECRDPDSASGDQNPSAGVADGTNGFERGTFHSFITNETISIFDFMVKAGMALSFRHALQRLGELSGKSFTFHGRSGPAPSTAPLPAGARALPNIQTNNRQLKDVVHDAWESVMRVNTRPDVFCRHQSIVRLRERGDELCIEDMTEDGVYEHISRTAVWVKVGDDGATDVFPPREVAKAMRAAPSKALPELESILACPVFGASGALISKPGYHAEEKLWYEPAKDLSVPEVPPAPSPIEIAAARNLLLDDLAGDFPFVSDSDRAHWLAALLLPFVRRMINGPTPLHFVEAPCNGAGKSLLCDLVSIVATGRSCNAQTLPTHEDEAAKTITAELLKAQAVILLDNQNERVKLNSPPLASALTSQHWTGRLLGQSKMLSLPNRAMWMMTGNNPNMTTEMARRCLRIRIDPKRDRAWTRSPEEFRHPKLKSWALENRNQLIHAIHTLVNAWVAAGKPDGAGSMGSFEDWAGVIGGILSVADVSGFLDCLEEMYRQADADGEAWNEFVLAWWREYADRPCKVSDLNSLCERENLLAAVRGDKGLRSQEIRLGLNLNSMRDRVFGSLRIASVDDAKYSKGGRMYALVEEKGDSEPVGDPQDVVGQLDFVASKPSEKGECGCCADVGADVKNATSAHQNSNNGNGLQNQCGCVRMFGPAPRVYARARDSINITSSLDRAHARTHIREGQPAQASAIIRTDAEEHPANGHSATSYTTADVGKIPSEEHPHIRTTSALPTETAPPPDRGEAWEGPTFVEPSAHTPDPWDPDYDPANDPYANPEEDA